MFGGSAWSTWVAMSPDENDACAQRLKVLADPTRLEVVRALLNGPRHVGELNERVDVEQSLLSHHLRVLREAGLVIAERDGKAMRYRLAPDIRPDAERQTVSLGCCRLSFDDAP